MAAIERWESSHRGIHALVHEFPSREMSDAGEVVDTQGDKVFPIEILNRTTLHDPITACVIGP